MLTGREFADRVARPGSTRAPVFASLEWGLVRVPLLPVERYPATWPRDGRVVAPVPIGGLVETAIAVASPDLQAALARPSPNPRQAVRAQRSLRRYLIRMTTRPTPFGLFAGVGLVRWDGATDLAIGDDHPRTRSRPDMAWLSAVVAALEADTDVRRGLRIVAHPAVHIRGGRASLTRPRADGSFEAVSVRATAPVRRVLQLTARPVACRQVVSTVADEMSAPASKVEGLITALWDNGFVMTDLRPPLTGAAPLRHVIDRLASVPAAASVVHELEALAGALADWDTRGPDERIGRLPQLVRRMDAVHPVASGATPLQVDAALPLSGHRLHSAVAHDGALAAELLVRLSPHPEGSPHLIAYRRAFEQRYGRERAVPLLELLDRSSGLGPPEEPAPVADPATRRGQALCELAIRASRDRQLVVELDDELLDRLQTWSPAGARTAPPSAEVTVAVAARSPGAVDAGEFLVIVRRVGPGRAGRSAGRFANLLGDDLPAALRRAAGEPLGDPLAVDLVWAPGDAASANVAVRPAIRPHEIVLDAAPGVSWDQVVALDQLVVTVQDGRFRIHWPAGGVEVVAEAGDALNLTDAPDVVRFLLDVAADRHVQPAPFSWGPAAGFPFLPRIQRGRVVLSPARWRVGRADAPAGPDTAFPEWVAAWRAEWTVPRHVCLIVADHRLLLDLDDPGAVDMLRDALRAGPGAESVWVEEALPGLDDAWLPGAGGRHELEVVIPLRRRPTSRPTPRPGRGRRPLPDPVGTADRLRGPGSDWLYLKLYCPASVHDELIAGSLREIGSRAIDEGLIDAWFFIRYADPEPHLRVRFHGAAASLIGELLSRLTARGNQLVSDGACSRFAFDTYEREVERYGGGEGVAVAERIFAADSVAVAEWLALHRGRPDGDDRLRFGALGIDDLLLGLGLDGEQRASWYGRESHLSREDGRAYRRLQDDLRRGLAGAGTADMTPVAAATGSILAARRARIAQLGQSLDAVVGGEAERKATLCRSYVHMHCNRLFPLDAPQEPQVLSLLRRACDSLGRWPVSPAGGA